MDLLDEAVLHFNITSLLHLKIRDPELDYHECVTSGLRQHSSLLISRTEVSRNKRISCPSCAKKIEIISLFSLPLFSRDIGQQGIRECKEIFGKRITKKLYFGNNVCVLGEIKNRAYK
jgi:hypothetical protein